MRRVPLSIAVLLLLPFAVIAAAVSVGRPAPPPAPWSPARPAAASPASEPSSVLDTHLLVTWYGNPWSERMGILGRLEGRALAEGLKKQAAAYAAVTDKKVISAYELVAIVAQPLPGRDGRYAVAKAVR